MLSHLDFVTFKNILNKNNIFLFDTQLRIAHYRYGKYISEYYESHDKTPQIQLGGSQELLLKDINNLGPNKLYHFIDSLLVKNYTKSNRIINLLSW
jgi:hypothetical protein